MDTARAEAALREALAGLRPTAEAVFVRHPLVDPDCPDTSDLDLLVFADVPDPLAERLHVPVADRPARTIPVDVLRVPLAALGDAERFARHGLMPHRLLAAEPVFDRTGYASAQARTVRAIIRRPAVQLERLAGILNFGSDVVREIGVTWAFPSLARFWLQMARAACLAVRIDAGGDLCPNVYTRPLVHLRALDRQRGGAAAAEFVEALGLRDDLDCLASVVRRLHGAVSRVTGRDLPASVRPATRAEYRYFRASEEVEWRIAVAREMERRGDQPAAVAYLRFWAYVLARVPMVHDVATTLGRSVSFLRPEREVRPALAALCPEILDDLARALGGPRPVTVGDVRAGLDSLQQIHHDTLSGLRGLDLEPPGLRPWQPFRSAPPSHDGGARGGTGLGEPRHGLSAL